MTRNPIKYVTDKIYSPGELWWPTKPTIKNRFIDDIFEDRQKFDKFAVEFDDRAADAIQTKHFKEYNEVVPRNQATFGGVGIEQARALYAVVRSEKPNVIVETGVCNGVSSYVVLLAINENQCGELYSIDYPTFSDDPIPEFQKDNYPDSHVFSAVPKDKEPGWVIPDDLTGYWELRLGKSQRELPPLLQDLGKIDLFFHDSDHTFPCMMFEYELAWEYLKPGGILLSDDVDSNDAFNTFGQSRADRHGKVNSGFGYAIKD